MIKGSLQCPLERRFCRFSGTIVPKKNYLRNELAPHLLILPLQELLSRWVYVGYPQVCTNGYDRVPDRLEQGVDPNASILYHLPAFLHDLSLVNDITVAGIPRSASTQQVQTRRRLTKPQRIPLARPMHA